jgi:membrane protein implicated in regulation of membrane protease activity
MTPTLSRMLTIVAAAVLAFDGAAVAAFGWWSGRVLLVLVGLMFFLSSGLLFLYWRWYQRRLEDIASTRRVLAEEAREIQRLIREK